MKNAIMASPFFPGNDTVYARWREEKLANYPRSAEALLVEISDLAAPSPEEKDALIARVRQANMAVYRCPKAAEDVSALAHILPAFAQSLGLFRAESHRSADPHGLVALEVVAEDIPGPRFGFIPYTNRPIRWHTDGYYNAPEERIRAMFLHCARPAASGGENRLLDPEIAYIRLRDENPDYIRALEHRRCMTIPSFTDADGRIRGECPGPVFSYHRYTADLHMRYTQRKRNVIWRDDALTQEAIAFLDHVLATDPLVITYRLQAGEGLICNNVLHDRSGFEDDPRPGHGRLMYRTRFFDRISGS